MIIGTNDKLAVGEIVTGRYWFNKKKLVLTRFCILGNASYEEWLEYRKSVGLPGEPMISAPLDQIFFYRVSHD